MRRRVGIVLLLVLVGALFPLTGAEAATGDGQCTDGVSGDFNGDGNDDLAIGVPFEDLGSDTDTGAVNVIYGSAVGLSATAALADQFFTQGNIGGTDEDGDKFGACLAAGDFNADGEDDLAIGVPRESTAAGAHVGVVDVLYGSNPGGLSSTGSQQFSQATTNIEGEPEEGDEFGSALATGDFKNDGADDLVVGVPREDIGSKENAGAVNIIYGVPTTGLVTAGNKAWFQDSSGVEDKSQTGDQFGSAAATGDFNGDSFDDLAIGVPLEDLDNNAGLVNVLYGTSGGIKSSGDQKWHQNSSGIGGQVEAGDQFGAALTTGKFNNDAFSDLAIGVPFEDIGAASNAGAVNVIYGSASKLSASAGPGDQLWYQGDPADDANQQADDTPQTGDQFGAALAAGDFTSADGLDELIVAAPLEDINDPEEGALTVIDGTSGGLSEMASHTTFLSQDTTGGTGESGDHWGSALTTGNYNGAGGVDAAVGAPDKFVGGDLGAGSVTVMYSGGTFAIFTQDTTDVEDDAEISDAFGSALS